MADRKVYFVKADWDEEAKVWYVTHTDIPGLVAEADTPQAMIDLVSELVPELLEMNSPGSDPVVPYSIMFDHITAHRTAA